MEHRSVTLNLGWSGGENVTYNGCNALSCCITAIPPFLSATSGRRRMSVFLFVFEAAFRLINVFLTRKIQRENFFLFC
jgi:hypothetical protein